MHYLPWYAGGAAMAAVVLVHWFLLHRMMAVSGRFTALVNRLRFGPEKKIDMSQAELEAALMAATAAAFGDDAIADDSEQKPPSGEAEQKPSGPEAEMPKLNQPQSATTHIVFMVGLVLGGLLSVALAGRVNPSFGLRGEIFNGFFHSKASMAAVLVGGGVLVGFGTRMAAGCTSGHGLCGVSRFQSGSMLATASFFGAGIITSFVLRFAL